jgi:hypothetical protein
MVSRTKIGLVVEKQKTEVRILHFGGPLIVMWREFAGEVEVRIESWSQQLQIATVGVHPKKSKGGNPPPFPVSGGDSKGEKPKQVQLLRE